MRYGWMLYNGHIFDVIAWKKAFFFLAAQRKPYLICWFVFDILTFSSYPVLGSPKDLVTKDVTESSFVASWTAAPGNVRGYRVAWKSLFTEEAGEKTVRGDVTTTVLDGLTPETRYKVSVYAAYGRGEGEPLVGEETTDGKSFPTCVMHLPEQWTLLSFARLRRAQWKSVLL